jgi:hypothetical protein
MCCILICYRNDLLSTSNAFSLITAIKKCDVGFYYCRRQRQCINGTRCDNNDDCGDRTDESVCGTGKISYVYMKSNYSGGSRKLSGVFTQFWTFLLKKRDRRLCLKWLFYSSEVCVCVCNYWYGKENWHWITYIIQPAQLRIFSHFLFQDWAADFWLHVFDSKFILFCYFSLPSEFLPEWISVSEIRFTDTVLQVRRLLGCFFFLVP